MSINSISPISSASLANQGFKQDEQSQVLRALRLHFKEYRVIPQKLEHNQTVNILVIDPQGNKVATCTELYKIHAIVRLSAGGKIEIKYT